MTNTTITTAHRVAARLALMEKAETDPTWFARFHDEAHDLGNAVRDLLAEMNVPVPEKVTDAVVRTAFL